MSIKNLFNSSKLSKVSKKKTTEDVKKVIESADFVAAKSSEFDRFIPPIDFSTASNFAKFGSAELYYQKAFERIHNYYPYDGTLHEKVEFENSSSYFDLYVLENLYPRTNGYLNFDGNIYITAFGGPHTASGGMIGKKLDSTFDSSMIYDEEKKRTSAFEYRGEDGISIEFWFKTPNTAQTRTIFHVTGATGELKLQLDSSNQFVLSAGSGSTFFSNAAMTSATPDADWNHYAFTMASSSEGTLIKSYRNGILEKQSLNTASSYNIPSILPTIGSQNIWIGASSDGSQLLTGSLDEFRFWKSTRTAEDIYNMWFVPVGGGTNKHDANIGLSLYYKFNEGKTGTDELDSTILDYSGRINNGYLTGSSYTYQASYRSTGSAIREKLNQPEFLDPIIYSSHPDVVATKNEYVTSGSTIDITNSSMMMRYLPGWMQEEDAQSGNNLKYLVQIMASHLDTLWHQISFLDKIKDKKYIQGSEKALPFAKKLLTEEGFHLPDLFSDATMLERFRNKDDNEIFEENIEEVKNIIYQNLYNSVQSIHKSKGTEKSIRNFFNSIGIGHDVVKINKYADDSTFVLRDNYEYKSIKKRYLSFNDEDSWGATIYTTASHNNGYIPGDKEYTGSFSLETEIFLPNKADRESLSYSPYQLLTSSIAGYHSTGSVSIYDFPATDYNLAAFVVRDRVESTLIRGQKQRIKFVMSGSFGEVETDFFSNQYTGNKWNLALRVRHEGYPFNNVSGSDEDNYIAELYGVETQANDKLNSFLITASLNRADYSADKVFYAGAERTNFTGAVLNYTDINLGHARYWQSYIQNSAIDQNAFDPEGVGTNEPFENDLVNAYSVEIPREKTLCFNWAFSTITGSDSSGAVIIPDLSSGSLESDYGSLSDTIQRYYPAQGYGFITSSASIVNSEFLYSATKRRPDDLMSSDLITIKNDETRNFFVDEDVSDNFYSFEKSMYAAVSDEMMNMFTTALDYNNLIGQPNQKYHIRYNKLDFLRDRFFEDVENEPDLERFTSFYKWIDESISIALEQLVPAGSRFSTKVNNIIESHILERSKYQHKFPIVSDFESTEGSIRGIAEMKYNWVEGHAPLEGADEEQFNCLWQRERKVKDPSRDHFRTVKNNHSIQSAGILRHDIQGNTYLSDVYYSRKFGKLYDVEMVSQNTIHGGPNFSRRKNLMLFHDAIAPNGEVGNVSGAPQNIITVGVGTGDGIIRKNRCYDKPQRKKFYGTNALVGQNYGDEYGHEVKGDEIFPMSLVSGTVHTGYNKIIKSFFAPDVILTNLHHDIVGKSNDVGMQGPFTNAHVGGLKYRHIDINRHDSSKSVQYVTSVAGTFPTASIEFDASVLQAKYLLGTSSWVQVRDADGSTIKAYYSDVYDLYEGQWTNMDQLQAILNNKLDVETNKISNSILNLTQSTTGSSYNYVIQTPSHGFVTSSGFGGGTNVVYTYGTRNLDGPGNRPEGWGLVFKDHPSQGDNDGAMGFIGADYGSPYPYTNFLKAEGYREEFAKRPVNIRNIKTSTGSAQVGNYKQELEILQLDGAKQKSWAIKAYDDENIDIIPPYYANNLPNTTHYQTLVTRRPSDTGNVFGVMNNNRQVDESLGSRPSLSINAASTVGDQYRMASDETVSGYPTSGGISFSFWINLDNTSTALRYVTQIQSGASNVFLVYFQSNNFVFYTVSTTAARSFSWSVTMSDFQNNWKHITLSWDGNQASNPEMYLDGVSQGAPTVAGSGTGTSWNTIDKIYLFDRGSNNSTSYELQGSMMNFAIWQTELSSGNSISMYNGGVVLDEPFTETKLLDFYYLGNELSGFEEGDEIPNGTTIPSSYGSANNDLVALDGLVIAQGADTETRKESLIIAPGLSNVIAKPRTDLTGSKNTITTRFSAPGGIEVQSIGYLDAYTQTHAVHNAMPYRNLSILRDSGEENRIRVTDHLGLRRGLRTLRTLHMGKFGIDSQYGEVTASVYPTSGSFYKQHSNISRRYEYSGSSETELITGSAYDNMYVNTPIPRSELQYSWIHAATSGSDAPDQNILGYAPKDGIISSSAGWVSALVFPTASSIFAD
jgi:hypothetical protein